MADATDDRIRELEIMLKIMDIEIILARRREVRTEGVAQQKAHVCSI